MELPAAPSSVSMAQLPEIYGHSRKVYALEYNCNGTLLASGSNDKTIRVWFVEGVRLLFRRIAMSERNGRLNWDMMCIALFLRIHTEPRSK